MGNSIRKFFLFIFGLNFFIYPLREVWGQNYNSLSYILESKNIEYEYAITKFDINDTNTYEKILTGKHDLGFAKIATNRYLGLGITSHKVWLRIYVYNDTENKKFILNFGNSHLDKVSIYQLNKKKTIYAGDFIPFSNWDIQDFKITVPIEIPPGEKEAFLIRIQTSSSLNIKPEFYEPTEFYKKQSTYKWLYGFFYGSVGIMIVYNFIIFLLIYEKVYLYYSLAILSNLCLQIFLNGMDLYVLGDFPEFRNSFGSIMVGCGAIFGVQFAREFLNTKNTMVRTDKILFIFGIFGISSMLLANITIPRYITTIFANVIAQFFAILIFITIIRGILIGVRQAKLFLIAWGLLLIGIILYTLLLTGSVPYNFITVFSNQFGSTLEATILSIAMAERLRTLKKEKEEAQQKAFQNLEQVVQERTKQLNDTLMEIQKDIQMAKRIQQDSLPDEDWVSTRIFFHRIYRPMSIIGGDTYDVEKVRDGLYRAFIADATGHGVQAALITMAIRSEYQAIKRVAENPAEILQILNKTIKKEYYSLNIVFTCCVVDIDINQGKVYFASAGHPDQLLIVDKNPIFLKRTGRIIGMKLDSTYHLQEFSIQPQDRVYLFTDGIVEQKNNEGIEFGESRLIQFLVENHYRELEVTLKELEKEWDNFRGNVQQSDDLTIIGLEVRPNPIFTT